MYHTKIPPPGTDAVDAMAHRGDSVLKKLVAGVRKHRNKIQLMEQPEFQDDNISLVELTKILKLRLHHRKKDAKSREHIDHLEKRHRWLTKRALGDANTQTVFERTKMIRSWFALLDTDGSGTIGLDELQDPLLSTGVASSREEVLELVKRVDKDGSGEVSLDEFMLLLTPHHSREASKEEKDAEEAAALAEEKETQRRLVLKKKKLGKHAFTFF